MKITTSKIVKTLKLKSYICDRCGDKHLGETDIFQCEIHGDFCRSCTEMTDFNLYICPDSIYPIAEIHKDLRFEPAEKIYFRIAGFKRLKLKLINLCHWVCYYVIGCGK